MRRTPARSWWQIPGGYVEVDEAIDVAMEREVLEETGVTARIREVVGFRHAAGLQPERPVSNIYVNPAWNYGMKRVRNEKVCILNDDLIFDFRVFNRVDELLEKDTTGAIGMAPGDHPTLTGQPPVTSGIIDIKPHEGEHLWGFGMLMFVKKSHWVPIPSDIKMYYGDNWIFDTNNFHSTMTFNKSCQN